MLRTSNQSGKFVYGFLTGSLIAGSLALLFAPKSGKKLRQQINKTFTDGKDELLSTAGDYLSTAKEKANDLLSEGKSKVNTLLGHADETVKGHVKHLKKSV